MPRSEAEAEQARETQRQESRRATLDLLRSKKRAEREFTLVLPGGEQAQFLFRAIGAVDYDRLVTKHPPTPEQRVEGHTFNLETFGPALLARVCADPEISEADWKKLWTSGDWSRGEVMQLWEAAAMLCNTGMDLVPTSSD